MLADRLAAFMTAVKVRAGGRHGIWGQLSIHEGRNADTQMRHSLCPQGSENARPALTGSTMGEGRTQLRTTAVDTRTHSAEFDS